MTEGMVQRQIVLTALNMFCVPYEETTLGDIFIPGKEDYYFNVYVCADAILVRRFGETFKDYHGALATVKKVAKLFLGEDVR